MRGRGHGQRIIAFLTANPNSTRAEIIAALNMKPLPLSQVLWRLKGERKIEVKFAGRFSTWDIVREKKPVSSVFAMLMGVE